MPEENGDVTAEQLLAAATEYDNSVSAGEPEPQFEIPKEPEPEPEGDQEAEAQDAEAEGGEEVAAEAPSDAEPESEGQDANEQVSSLTEGEAAEAVEQPKKSKWARNEERKSRSWQEINAAKEENKRKEQEIAEKLKEIELQREELNSGKAYRDEDGRTSEDYRQAAKILEESGKTERASELLEQADSLDEKSAEIQQELERKKAVDSVVDGFSKAKSELESQFPELRVPDSDLTQESNEILKSHPDLLYLPDGQGLRHAVQVAQWKIGSRAAEAKESEVRELTEKLTKLEKKLSVDGGYTNEKVSNNRGFEDMSDDEQMAYLRKAAMEADSSL